MRKSIATLVGLTCWALPLRGVALGAALVCITLSSAQAHEIIASAWSEGESIQGEVGFSHSHGGVAAPGTRVEVLGPDGATLGETTVDAEGMFHFVPKQAVPHTFEVDMGAGHVARVTLPVEELPLSLLRTGGAETGGLPSTDSMAGEGPASPVPVPAAIASDLDIRIGEMIRRELRPLRKAIAACKKEQDLQGILGGLGYIAGIFGLLFFVAAYRQRGKQR